MKFRKRLVKETVTDAVDEIKEKVNDSRWMPVVIAVISTVVVVRVCTPKQPQVNINVNVEK